MRSPARVLVALPCIAGALFGQVPSNTLKSHPLTVEVAEAPSWWIPPAVTTSGVRSPDGPLYFRAVLRNPNTVPISVDVSFQSYLPDGTRYEGCYAPGGGGGGVTTDIAPHGSALVVCNRARVPLTVQHLQVTSRTWSVTPVSATSRLAAIVEAGPIEGEHFPYGVNWDAYARVKSQSARDVDVRLFFRFLSADSLQVATCASDDLHVEAEIVLKAKCSVPADLPNGVPQPVFVQVDVRRPDS